VLAYSGQVSGQEFSQQFLPVTGAVLAVRPDGTGAHVVVEWADRVVQQIVWSPDGRQIAVVVNRLVPASDGSGTIQGTETELWVVNSDGSHARLLGQSAEDAPSWAPDGQHLVFASARNDRLEIADTSAQPVALRSFAVRHIFVWAPVWSALPGLVGLPS
jgi:dipeptidyl aminopeptidase/acylaminoacyl peptidase